MTTKQTSQKAHSARVVRSLQARRDGAAGLLPIRRQEPHLSKLVNQGIAQYDAPGLLLAAEGLAAGRPTASTGRGVCSSKRRLALVLCIPLTAEWTPLRPRYTWVGSVTSRPGLPSVLELVEGGPPPAHRADLRLDKAVRGLPPTRRCMTQGRVALSSLMPSQRLPAPWPHRWRLDLPAPARHLGVHAG